MSAVGARLAFENSLAALVAVLPAVLCKLLGLLATTSLLIPSLTRIATTPWLFLAVRAGKTHGSRVGLSKAARLTLIVVLCLCLIMI